MGEKIQLYGLGTASFDDDGVFVFFRDSQSTENNTFRVNKGHDGVHFKHFSCDAKISAITSSFDPIEECSYTRISQIAGVYYMTYAIEENGKKILSLARSRDLISWEKIGVVAGDVTSGMIVPAYDHNGRTVMYVGTESLHVAYADTPDDAWRIHPAAVLHHDDYIHKILVADVKVIDEGIFVAYYIEHYKAHGASSFTLHGALFDNSDPTKLLWRTDAPIPDDEHGRTDLLYPFGLVIIDDAFFSYWQSDHGTIVVLSHPFSFEKKEEDPEQYELTKPTLLRHEHNPILAPQEHRPWESRAVLNPATIYEGGRIHILYRAIGDSDISVLGYAVSSDGVTIEQRLSYPAYVPTQWFEGVSEESAPPFQRRGNGLYASGGGAYGGCEDPKLTRIGDTIYMTYVAFNGWSPPRLALTSITMSDFLAHQWNWKKPVLISPPDVIDKSGCILPEKINGKYVIFHRIFPDVMIDFVDSLDDFDGETHFLEGEYRLPLEERKGMWDGGKFSIGAPPIKTDKGWLVIYHATTGRQEWEGSDLRYKIGAMLLDLKNPTKVLYRTNNPLIIPQTEYENSGEKAGVVYPCGAVIKDDTLYVHYGGSDSYVCVASAPLTQFLADLIDHDKEPQLNIVKE